MMRWNRQLSSGLAALRIGATCLAATACVHGLTASLCQASDVVYSSNARFRIPYQLDAQEIRRLRASEIQLHVSTDQGKSWRNVDSVPPVAGKFTFEAAQDGEYWFSVRTISEDGRHHPSGPLTAGLKVNVDTERPTLSLEVSESEPGQVAMRWSAADDHLSAESLTIECRTANDADWKLVETTSVAGETSWPLPQGGTLTVRGLVRDHAGNETTAQGEVTIAAPASSPAPASPAPATPARQLRQPIAEGPVPDETTQTGEPLAAAQDQAWHTAPDAARTTALPVINPYGTDYSQFVSQRETTAASEARDQPQTAKEAPQQPAAQSPSDQLAAASPRPNAATPQQPVAPQDPVSTSPQSQSQRPRVQRVNSTSFKIGYELEDVGPSGVSRVDLFLTEDGGSKWFHYGSDEDVTSPFEVTVPADGTYGFSIRVRSGVGLSQSPPQPGEAPEMTLAVDRQPPQVTLKPLKQGDGRQPNQLQIEWSISDDELAERPVSLLYASQPGGPWHSIAGEQPDTGRYLWTFGPDIPPQVYVRLEARDAAGNIARADSPTPLAIDLSRPSARIIEVDPLPSQN